ncbi:MAG: hypothetical protein WBF81_03270 [Thermoplasmata archaeon]
MNDTVSLSLVGDTVPSAQYDTATAERTSYPGFSGHFASGDLLSVDTASTGPEYGLDGEQLVCIGANGIVGSVASAPFP